ncbi:amino acid ABC transporter permease [Alkalicoccobacillus murimartini]|uniref:General L-amino acid transport system permease protein n=1 Tax=Alkalicoccobacillus murimartini TaxID=171685 RepID=A0ABT9YJM8_9BACI|nr:ABC transporter permease subunit [Alkalicoccobacillus murimartini]MDQ0208060.1 general L-amino acid transport system permease protein [Alkalicoccobacillus murimartini]
MAQPSTQNRPPFWRNQKYLNIIWQVLFLGAIIGVIYFLATNAIAGLNRAGLGLSFNFLSSRASFPIGESVISFAASDTFLRALSVGFLNTLKVSIIGIVLTTIVGVIVGVSRLSSNWLLRTISTWYIEIFRNTPVLVQIFFWYFAVMLAMPRIQDVNANYGFIVSNRGFVFPWFDANSTLYIWLGLLLIALVAAFFVFKWKNKQQIEKGVKLYPSVWFIGVMVLTIGVGYLIFGEFPASLSIPEHTGTGSSGGYRFSPEFAAILFALVMYTATYIAEIVRGGILAVPKGQIEAAEALGLSSSKILRFVTFPQAIRTIIPPVTSQYLGLAKNSSLAVAVGYPDLFSVGSTTLNQTGRAIEVITIMLLAYLTISVVTSLLMNLYNKYTALVER